MVKTTVHQVPCDSSRPLLDKTIEGQLLSNSARPSLVKTTERQLLSDSARLETRDTTRVETCNPVITSTLDASTDSRKTYNIRPTLVNKKLDTLPNHAEGVPRVEKTSTTPQDEVFGLGDSQIGLQRSQPFKPRRFSLMPDWPDDVEFDENEDVLTIGNVLYLNIRK